MSNNLDACVCAKFAVTMSHTPWVVSVVCKSLTAHNPPSRAGHVQLSHSCMGVCLSASPNARTASWRADNDTSSVKSHCSV